MYSSARTAAISSSNRLRSPISRNNSTSSEYDVEACERTPLLQTRIKIDPSNEIKSQHCPNIHLKALLSMLALVLFLMLGIIIAVYLLLLQVPHPWPVSHPFYLVERCIWWAYPVAMTAEHLNKSVVENVIVTHTRSEQCNNQPLCIQYLRDIQQDEWTRNKAHIPYNFLIGGDGKTYEGRGWRSQHGFAELPGKNDTIVVGVIGTYSYSKPEKILYAETKALITESIRRHALSPNYRLYGVINSTIATSDGEALYSELKSWKHWKGFIAI